MADVLATNNAVSSLASGLSNAATSLTLGAGEGARFPTPSAGNYFYATIIDTLGNFEIVKATARATDILTIVRAQDNTTAKTFSAGSSVQLLPVAAVITDIFAAINSKLASASYTAADVLAKLLTVDGAGSGLDADLLDGQSSAYYTDIAARLGYTPLNAAGGTVGSTLVLGSNSVSGSASGILLFGSGTLGAAQLAAYGQSHGTNPGRFRLRSSNGASNYDLISDLFNGIDLQWRGQDVWYAGNDGSGSGLDADLLDGVEGANYAQKSTGTWTPVLTAGSSGPPTYTVNAARWERHGNIKHFYIDITISAANGSGAYYTVTLPDAVTYAAIAAGRDEAGEWLLARAPNGTDDLTFQTAAAGMPSVGQIILRGTYEM